MTAPAGVRRGAWLLCAGVGLAVGALLAGPRAGLPADPAVFVPPSPVDRTVPVAPRQVVPSLALVGDLRGAPGGGEALAELVSRGIYPVGADSRVHPGAPVTRARLAGLLVRTLGPGPEERAPGGDAMAAAVERGWFRGDARGRLRPGSAVGRGEFALVVARTLSPDVGSPEAAFAALRRRGLLRPMEVEGHLAGWSAAPGRLGAPVTNAQAAGVLLVLARRLDPPRGAPSP